MSKRDSASSSEPPSSSPSPGATSPGDSVPPQRVASAPDSVTEFAGWGTVEEVVSLGSEPIEVKHLDGAPGHKLGTLASTAICGNDITSSCLYVAALCSIAAGPYAPICLLAVGLMLYLFRSIYAEVGSALPLNGGAYNALLNTTSKFKASLAACLTILSYLATAVISAGEAMHYLDHLVHLGQWHPFNIDLGAVVGEAVSAEQIQQGMKVHSSFMVNAAAVGLLAFFAVLSVIGIGESAAVAVGIFVIHIATLVLLVGSALIKFGFNFDILLANLAMPPPGGIGKALVFGFAAGLLGISGFESSANFIEEQKPGVFPKTLRNMWIAVIIFNPLISLLAMSIMPMSDAVVMENGVAQARPDFLAHMGNISAGSWLANLVSVDAVLVLSGAVLTAYVGVTGLVRRMALDRCLPQFLLKENRARGTNHWIILLFFGLAWSIVAITKGQIDLLAGVYTISFLGVMALFAIGNMLLKVKRRRLPRAVRASWPGVVVALIAVLIGLVANAVIDYPTLERVRVFIVYFAVAVGIVSLTFLRAQLLKVMLAVLKSVIVPLNDALTRKLEQVNAQEVVFFSKGDNRANLNRAALYVLRNETTKRLKVVHVYRNEEDSQGEDLADQLRTIDELYPELRIDLLLIKGQFGPELIERLSRRTGIPKNYMFLGTPGDRFPHNIAELGGVRLII